MVAACAEQPKKDLWAHMKAATDKPKPVNVATRNSKALAPQKAAQQKKVTAKEKPAKKAPVQQKKAQLLPINCIIRNAEVLRVPLEDPALHDPLALQSALNRLDMDHAKRSIRRMCGPDGWDLFRGFWHVDSPKVYTAIRSHSMHLTNRKKRFHWTQFMADCIGQAALDALPGYQRYKAQRARGRVAEAAVKAAKKSLAA